MTWILMLVIVTYSGESVGRHLPFKTKEECTAVKNVLDTIPFARTLCVESDKTNRTSKEMWGKE